MKLKCDKCMSCIASGSVEDGVVRITSRRCKIRDYVLVSQRLAIQCKEFSKGDEE